MVSLDHGTHLFKGSMPERSQSISIDYGNNAHKKKLEQQIKKKRWEVNIKLLQYTPRKAEETLIPPKVSTSTRKIILEEIYLNSDAIHLMKEDTLPNIVLETKITLIGRMETREDIMLMLQKMMNLPQRESDDSSSDEEYVLISALTGNITHGSNDWIIDSGSSKHMMGFKESFVKTIWT